MKIIELTQGKIALIDDGDYELISKYTWYACKHHSGGWYAKTSVLAPERGKLPNGGNKRKDVRMHELIMGCKGIDHEDGNGLNNQRYNLRKATSSQNSANRRKLPNRSSKYKGVTYIKKSGHWSARICSNYKYERLGTYNTETEAALAYNKRARELFGEFAKLNQISSVTA